MQINFAMEWLIIFYKIILNDHYHLLNLEEFQNVRDTLPIRSIILNQKTIIYAI